MPHSQTTPILGAEIARGQETFLAPSADKQTRNYDTELSNHHVTIPLYTHTYTHAGLLVSRGR